MKVAEYLTEEVLRDLYENHLFTENEIVAYLQEQGVKFRDPLHQVKVNKLRKKYGIATITKGERIHLQMPPMTEKQQEVLLGSLLGDASISPTSPGSARLHEGHSLDQEAYLRWKAQIFSPYLSPRGVYPHQKKSKGGVMYKGVSFLTHASPFFWPYYEKFYPNGGPKVFPPDLPDILTPRALAVWYMDDGSLRSNYHPSISFGLGQESLKTALKALRKLGFRPSLYRDHRHKTYEIRFPNPQDVKFFDMIRPFVPPCMEYKLPVYSDRKLNDIHATSITQRDVLRLQEEGLSVIEIAEALGTSPNTIRRRAAEGDKKFNWCPKVNLYDVAEADSLLANLYEDHRDRGWGGLNISQRNDLVKGALDVVERSVFPYPPRTENPLEEFQRVIEIQGYEDVNGYIRPRGYSGVALCKPYFPHRYNAEYKGGLSVRDTWNIGTELRKAITIQAKRIKPSSKYNPLTLGRILISLEWVSKTPTVFRPGVAKYIYDRYAPCPSVVWDPCSGYGGRLLGAMASGVEYIGTDVDPETIQGNQELADALSMGGRVHLHCGRAEAFDPGLPLDLVFTSPPYFNREHYSQNSSQSYNEYGGSVESWVTGFLAPVIATAHERLKAGKHMVINIADIKENRKVTPLVQLTMDAAKGAGFCVEHTLKMPLSGRRDYEPVLVFKKR